MTTQTTQDNDVTASVTSREAHQTADLKTHTKEKNSMQEPTISDVFGPAIHIYTRAQAIADGLLVDVSLTAREAGFSVPVAVTKGVWVDCIAWDTASNKRQTYQDEAGRLWDVLAMAGHAARNGDGERVSYQLYRIPRGGRRTRPVLTTLHMTIGPGNEGEPVVTILLPGED